MELCISTWFPTPQTSPDAPKTLLLPHSVSRVQQQKLVHPFRGFFHLDVFKLGDGAVDCPGMIAQHGIPSDSREEKIVKREAGVILFLK